MQNQPIHSNSPAQLAQSAGNDPGARHGVFGGASQTLHSIAQALYRQSRARKIEAHCNAIEADSPGGIQVRSRKALSQYLVDQRVFNPGGLTDRQRKLCAWTLLEHVARADSRSNVATELVSSYIERGEFGQAMALAKAATPTRI